MAVRDRFPFPDCPGPFQGPVVQIEEMDGCSQVMEGRDSILPEKT
jgi:hypothetical protein